MKTLLKWCIALILLVVPCILYANSTINIPILCYHNLNPTRPGSMNMTPQKFESQIQWLKQNGFNIITLKEAVDYLQGKTDTLPKKSIVITFDDGWQSVYTYLLPIVQKYHFPVTLFIYPQTISTGKNAMTWEELLSLEKTGWFDVQSHTYSHPNFKHAKRQMSPDTYQRFMQKELGAAKKILEEKMGKKIVYLAWPFGIYDAELEQQAAAAGYEMAFTIDARTANRGYRPMAQPRFMIIDAQSMKTYMGIANGALSTRVAESKK